MEGTAEAADTTSPLTLSEAVKAFTTPPAEDVPSDQADAKPGDEGHDEAADDSQEPEAESAADEGDDDGEPGDEDQAEAEGEEDATEGSDQGRFVSDTAKVKLSDGRVVSVADLKQGSLLMPDYTRKTQEVAEQRRALETQSSTLKQQETQVAQDRDYVAALLQSIVPQPPSPTKADPNSPDFDPVGYQAERAHYEHWMTHLQTLDQAKQRTEQERQAETRKTEAEVRQREWAALTADGKAPDLRDEKRLTRFVAEVKEHGAAYGYSPQELARLPLDHRQSLVLRDAINWRKLQAQKPKVEKKIEGRPPVQRGGKRLSPGHHQAREANAAMERLNQSGRLSDGVAAFIALQKKG